MTADALERILADNIVLSSIATVVNSKAYDVPTDSVRRMNTKKENTYTLETFNGFITKSICQIRERFNINQYGAIG